jgi:hypothetical protein
MELDRRALQGAAQDLFNALGPIDDLGKELSNTVANVYYRFHLMSQKMANPAGALNVEPGRDMISDYRKVMGAMGETLAQYKTIEKIISEVRAAWRRDPSTGYFLTNLTLDLFKYRIPNAEKKMLIRRAIERPFRRVDEIAGLYKEMSKVPLPLSKA